jgi:hypothetical protein
LFIDCRDFLPFFYQLPSRKAPNMNEDSTDIAAGCEPVSRPVDPALTLDGLDQRQRPFRRYRAISGAILSDLGGEDQTSEVQRQLVSRFAMLALTLEGMEAGAIEGSALDLDLFARGAGHLRRIGEALGMKRVPRDVTTLAQYLEQKAAAE